MTASTASDPHRGLARFMGTVMGAPPLPLVMLYVRELMNPTNLSKCACVVSSADFHDRLPGCALPGGRIPALRRSWPWNVLHRKMVTSCGHSSASAEELAPPEELAAAVEARFDAGPSSASGVARFFAGGGAFVAHPERVRTIVGVELGG